jgi:Methyltransferase FkbM domain
MSSNEILKSNKTTKIALRTIDSMRELPLAGLIKIDVEGQELEVLIGAENYIKRSGYHPIFFEAWNYFWHQEKKNNLLNYLKDIGYDFFENCFNILAQSSKTAKVLLNFNKQKDGITIQQSIKK